jgi:hypothetical protein
MFKSSSLCLYSSNLGTFWLKIEQFWPFVKKNIYSNGGHLGYILSQSQQNLAEMILRWSPFKIVSISAVLYPRWPPLLKNRNFFKWPKLLFIVMAAILDTGRR